MRLAAADQATYELRIQGRSSWSPKAASATVGSRMKNRPASEAQQRPERAVQLSTGRACCLPGRWATAGRFPEPSADLRRELLQRPAARPEGFKSDREVGQGKSPVPYFTEQAERAARNGRRREDGSPKGQDPARSWPGLGLRQPLRRSRTRPDGLVSSIHFGCRGSSQTDSGKTMLCSVQLTKRCACSISLSSACRSGQL